MSLDRIKLPEGWKVQVGTWTKDGDVRRAFVYLRTDDGKLLRSRPDVRKYLAQSQPTKRDSLSSALSNFKFNFLPTRLTELREWARKVNDDDCEDAVPTSSSSEVDLQQPTIPVVQATNQTQGAVVALAPLFQTIPTPVPVNHQLPSQLQIVMDPRQQPAGPTLLQPTMLSLPAVNMVVSEVQQLVPHLQQVPLPLVVDAVQTHTTQTRYMIMHQSGGGLLAVQQGGGAPVSQQERVQLGLPQSAILQTEPVGAAPSPLSASTIQTTQTRYLTVDQSGGRLLTLPDRVPVSQQGTILQASSSPLPVSTISPVDPTPIKKRKKKKKKSVVVFREGASPPDQQSRPRKEKRKLKRPSRGPLPTLRKILPKKVAVVEASSSPVAIPAPQLDDDDDDSIPDMSEEGLGTCLDNYARIHIYGRAESLFEKFDEAEKSKYAPLTRARAIRLEEREANRGFFSKKEFNEALARLESTLKEEKEAEEVGSAGQQEWTDQTEEEGVCEDNIDEDSHIFCPEIATFKNRNKRALLGITHHLRLRGEWEEEEAPRLVSKMVMEPDRRRFVDPVWQKLVDPDPSTDLPLRCPDRVRAATRVVASPGSKSPRMSTGKTSSTAIDPLPAGDVKTLPPPEPSVVAPTTDIWWSLGSEVSHKPAGRAVDKTSLLGGYPDYALMTEGLCTVYGDVNDRLCEKKNKEKKNDPIRVRDSEVIKHSTCRKSEMEGRRGFYRFRYEV